MTSIGFPKHFDINVASIVAQYLTPVPNKFFDWVDQNKLDWHVLSGWVDDSILFDNKDKIKPRTDYDWEYLRCNPNAIHFIDYILAKTNYKPEAYYCNILCANENAMELLTKLTKDFTKCLHSLDWTDLCNNKNAIGVLSKLTQNFTKHLGNIDWVSLSGNVNAIPILERFFFKFKNDHDLNWSSLCKNPKAIDFIDRLTEGFTTNLDKVNWDSLAVNENAIHIVDQIISEDKNKETYLQRIKLDLLFKNQNAASLFDKYLDSIQTVTKWDSLCANPNAIPFLQKITNNFRKNLEKINWHLLCSNPNLNPNAIPILRLLISKSNFSIVPWNILSQNPNIHQFVKPNHIQHLDWKQLSKNHSIIEVDMNRYNVWLNHISHSVYNL